MNAANAFGLNVNAIGLALDIIGALLLAWAQMHRTMTASGGDAPLDRIGRHGPPTGWILIVAGFGLQFIAAL
jgi:hypothetical protein